jgi:hypothetical protein
MSEFVNTLPSYTAKRSESFPGFLIVTCGWDDCPGTVADRPFLVSEREWLRPNRLIREIPNKPNQPIVITGRSCPYCFRANRLPRRRDIS